MIPATSGLCAACFEPFTIDESRVTVEVAGEPWQVHRFKTCRSLIWEAPARARERQLATLNRGAESPVTVPSTVSVPSRTAAADAAATVGVSESLPPGIGRGVCATHVADGRPDLWTDSTPLGTRGYPKQRARLQREARLACIGCPSLIQCVKYAAGFEWAAGTTIAGWSSPSNHNSPQADRLHPGLPAVLEQARRDRAEARRTRSKPSEAEGVPEHQSGRSGRPVADAQRAIAI